MKPSYPEFDRAIIDIKASYGLDLAPDEQGLVRLVFPGEVDCTIETAPETGRLHYHFTVDRPGPEAPASLWRDLLSLNAFELPLPDAWLALEAETEEVLLCGGAPLAGVTADSLVGALGAAAELARNLRELLAEARERVVPADEEPDPVEGPDLRFDSMVRA